MEDLELDRHVVRTDPLTDCPNLIAFAETIHTVRAAGPDGPFSLFVMDVNAMEQLNRNQGHLQGDRLLRWLALLAQAELDAPVYRIGGDEFVAFLPQTTPDRVDVLAARVFDLANRQAQEFGLQSPVVSIAALHYPPARPPDAADLFAQLYIAIATVKQHHRRTVKSFHPADLPAEIDARTLRLVTGRLIERLMYLGGRLDELLEMAFSDPLTGLPNQRLAARQLRKLLAHSAPTQRPFSLLLIDGDDLRLYNEISYAEGDEMIHNLGRALREALRPPDFLARWKSGDEFLALLASTDMTQARAAAERLCAAVRQASQSWRLPVSVTVGVAVYPQHGQTALELVAAAEQANHAAKQAGKNRVEVYRSGQ